MKQIETNSTYHNFHNVRYEKTLRFLSKFDLINDSILDLGPKNPFSEMLIDNGYNVTNTKIGQDLDLDYEIVKSEDFDAVFAFEILEHLVSPFPVLKAIKAKKLVISVPLSLWFSSAYWNENDPYDRHYHEFEPKQLEMLLNKAGWNILDSEKHVSKSGIFGIRPLLRMITPRHYFVYCERA